MIVYRPYQLSDEQSWLRCRLLSFFDSEYYDDAIGSKPHYDNDSIDLVAVDGNTVIGFIDTEIEDEPETLCYGAGELGCAIWNLGVHPDYQRQGIASALLAITVQSLRDRGIQRVQAWTREDTRACAWYEARGFKQTFAYWHVWYTGGSARDAFRATQEKLTLISAYGEYTGTDPTTLSVPPDRLSECRCYELSL